MKLFTPPGAPSWLDPLLRRIRQGLAEPWESPLRLQSIVTANLPPAADWEGGIVYDDTTSTAKISDGATWAALGGSGGVSDGDKGDITVSGSGATWTIDNDAVTFAKIQNITDARVLGRSAGSAGDMQELTVAGPLTLSGGALDFDETAALGNVARTTVRKNTGADVGSRRRLNFIEGSNITLTVSDDAGNEEIDVTIAASGSGGGGSGTTVVDFGAFPGASDASATVTGQAGILGTSRVRAWIEATATADHSADEHWVETIAVTAGNISAGTGFTIYAKNTGTLSEPVAEQWGAQRLAGAGGNIRPDNGGGKGTRLYGQFTVGWEWS